ncbi:protoporphyrinogen oxidase [Streptomyces sp. NPDC050095]|uniref:protoporphyrinogen oxidase n=1 Tax=unclassified Streptomyces TaxID=2593676 RepID=UPI003432745B
MRSVIIIGGGISGLAAAWELRGHAHVTVLESAPQVGGQMRSAYVGGVAVDVGAESLTALRPEAIGLAREVGLGMALRDPARAGTVVWSDGALRTFPARHVMGIPVDPAALAGSGLLSDDGVDRLCQEEALPAHTVEGDVPVGEYLTRRIGREAVDRLVAPLVGARDGSSADRLSLRATLPRVAAVADHGGSVIGALRSVRGATPSQGALAQGLDGGLSRLPRAVAEASGALVLTRTRARELQRTPFGRWRVVAATGDGPLVMEADAVICALPAQAAAALLRPHAPAAEAELESIRHAGTAVVTLGFSRAFMPKGGPQGNGYVVPQVEGWATREVTYLSNKWQHLAAAEPGLFLLRISLGHMEEEQRLAVPDRHLVRQAVMELRQAAGTLGEPVASQVTRWESALPQYDVGHKERVTRIRSAVRALPGVDVCGAAYEGVDVAACVATGRAAARRVLAEAA